MVTQLLGNRRFAPLFWCQFFAAFNDTYFKSALTFLAIFKLAPEQAKTLTLLGTVLLTGPAFLLSALGGEWADRYDKARMAQRLKLVEFGGVALAGLGFLTQSLPILFFTLALFGVLSALFGPIKYGILPDHLSKEELASGNALVEGATFIAAILGPTVAALVSNHGHGDPRWAAALTLLFAAFSYGAARLIPPTGEAAPQLKVDANIVRSTGRLMRLIHRDKRLWRTAIITSLFWMMAAIVYSLLAPIVTMSLGGDEMVFDVYNAAFAIGIAIGSGLAAWLLAGRTLMLPTPIAAILIGFVSLDLAAALHGATATGPLLGIAAFFHGALAWRVGIDLALLALCGGLYIVPSFAALLAWAPAEERARLVAGVNVLNTLFMVAGLVATMVLQNLGASFSTIFALLGFGSLFAGAAILRVLPTNPLRDLTALVFRLVYRLEVKGIENLAKAGPNAIIVLNHVSLLDAEIAFAILENGPVFAIDHAFAQKWWMRPIVRFMNALPLDPTRPLATRQMIQAVKSGKTLVIFPEGRLTRTGSLMKVYDGSGLIAEKSGVPVVPVRIEGAEKTRFSYLTREQVFRPWIKHIKVTVLEPQRVAVPDHLKGRARRQAAGAALYTIMSDMVFQTTDIDRTVHAAVVAAAHEHGVKHKVLEDPVAGTLSYKRALIGARVLGRKLSPLAPVGGTIGVMLPTSVGAFVTFLALNSAGRVAAMVNFTAGAANIRSAGAAAQFDTILTSRAFIEKGRLDKLVTELTQSFRIVYLEEVRAGIGTLTKIDGLIGWRRPLARRKGDDPAAVLFTSGSEGKPKGVVLSHTNMLANAAQARAVVDFGRQDTVFNVLPMFHAFGLTIGTVVPLVSGVKTYLYPTPLHYRIIPELVYGTNATILFGTDTFLAGYAKTAHPYDFRSVRYIMAGAEPVRDQTRAVYQEKFGLRVLEGYGITEMAPVVALNTPMFNKNGSVGRVMPGIETRIEPVSGIEEGGKLFLSGPNVMRGYLKEDAPGVLQPPVDGWHDTGDIVTLDERGYLTIKGRAKRFAKIAGEMVSLAAVEDLASRLWPDTLSAAATLPDARKGERIVLLTMWKGATRADFVSFAKSRHASDLMVPSEVVVVETIPLLGSGKLDFAAVSQLVREMEARKASAA